MRQPLYVCVHVPEFPAQALLRLRPALSHSAVAVIAGDPPLEQVCSANMQALRLGVVQGMTRAELETFVGITVIRRVREEERRGLSVLLEAAGAFTPRIEVQISAESAFIMVLDMTGSSRIFGSVAQVTASISRALATLRFHVLIAASANLHAAVCIAPAARKAPIIIPYGREGESLRNLSIAALNLTPEQKDILSLWGLHTLGELAALPEVELVVRLGQEGKRLRLMARGERPHLMVPEEPAFLLEEFLAFDAPVELLESLLFVVGPMLDQLLTRAQNRAFALASVTIKLGLEGGGEHQRTIKPALPVAQQDVLMKLLHLDLQAHPPSAGVVSIFLHAERGDRSKVQLGLFAPQLPESTRLDVTLARIAALVGEDRVGRAALLDRHRPDAFRMERFVVPLAQSPRAAAKDAATQHVAALRRCRPAIDLSVRQEGKRLESFFLHGKHYSVQQAYGPWRKSGDWWASEVWSCEEWDVQAVASTDERLLCLLTHDLLRHHWQLEAFYD